MATSTEAFSERLAAALLAPLDSVGAMLAAELDKTNHELAHLRGETAIRHRAVVGTATAIGNAVNSLAERIRELEARAERVTELEGAAHARFEELEARLAELEPRAEASLLGDMSARERREAT